MPPRNSQSGHQLIQNTWGWYLEFEFRVTHRPAEARTAYAAAVSMEPSFATGHFNLGTLIYYSQLDRPQVAAAALERAIAAAPRGDAQWQLDGAVYVTLGAVKLQMGDKTGARPHNMDYLPTRRP